MCVHFDHDHDCDCLPVDDERMFTAGEVPGRAFDPHTWQREREPLPRGHEEAPGQLDRDLYSAGALADRLVKIGARIDVGLAEEELRTPPIGGRVTTGVSAYTRVA